MNDPTNYISLESCKSLVELFLIRVDRSPEKTAYCHYNKIKQQWENLSWTAMLERVCWWRAALIEEKLQKGDRVALMLPNSPEWIALEQAALSLGLLVVPLYANDRPENIGYILNDTETKLLVCPGLTYYQFLAEELKKVASLQRIVTIDDCRIQEEEPRLSCITDWLPAQDIATKPYQADISEIATIVYTSGTTGPPKGVMLSHRNILENSNAGLQCMDIYESDSFLSFLPLSHMLERTVGYYLPMMSGAKVSFARSIPDLAEDLLTVKPTILVSVPRIFERVYAGIQTKVKEGSSFTKKLFSTAVATGWKHFLYTQNRTKWDPSFILRPALDQLVGKKVRDKLGGQLRIIISGGAPLSADISEFFIGLGLPIFQGYGLTETSPVISVNRFDDNRPDGVGTPLPGFQVTVGEHDELMIKGPCVMQGYWKNPGATAETIDDNGWLHTGDRVAIHDGHIQIIGRLKEILVLSNGEKIAPADMEMAICLDPLFEHALVVGEGKPFLTLLCVLNIPLWEKLAEELAVSSSTESLQLKQVREKILTRIEKLLSKFPGFVFIKDVSPSLTPWTVEQGLLTPTLKLKRKTIEQQMAKEIEELYSD